MTQIYDANSAHQNVWARQVGSDGVDTGAATVAVLGATTGAAVTTDATGAIQQYLRGLVVLFVNFLTRLPASLGTKLASASLSITQGAFAYETVAASQTNQAMGATGATGDYLSHVIIMPLTIAAGTVTILDNATVFFTFTTGTLADLRPIIVPIGCNSVSGAWKITTGANVTAVGVGTFT